MVDAIACRHHRIQEAELHEPADPGWRAWGHSRGGPGRMGQRQLDVLGEVGIGQAQHAAAGEVVEGVRDAGKVGAQIDRALRSRQHAQETVAKNVDRWRIDRAASHKLVVSGFLTRRSVFAKAVSRIDIATGCRPFVAQRVEQSPRCAFRHQLAAILDDGRAAEAGRHHHAGRRWMKREWEHSAGERLVLSAQLFVDAATILWRQEPAGAIRARADAMNPCANQARRRTDRAPCLPGLRRPHGTISRSRGGYTLSCSASDTNTSHRRQQRPHCEQVKRCSGSMRSGATGTGADRYTLGDNESPSRSCNRHWLAGRSSFECA